MSEKEEAGAASDAKGVTENFIQSLGLIELIIGGVGSYALWLLYRGQTSNLFPSTGTKLIDIGLLAFAAALVGKLVCLAVAAGMGLMWVIIKRIDLLGYQKDLERAVFDCNGVNNHQQLSQKLGLEKPDLKILALYSLVLADPKQQTYFERIHTKIIVAYSICVLAVLYVPYLHRAGAPSSILTFTVLGVLLFFLLGCLEQHLYLKVLSLRLLGAQLSKRQQITTTLSENRWRRIIIRR
jgi:hypothetical protein